MSVAALFWLVFIALLVIGVVCVLVSRSGGTGGELTRAQKQELKDARALLKSIEKTCIEYRESSPNLSDIIRADIDAHNLKELT